MTLAAAVARTVEDDHRHVLRRLALRTGHRAHVVADGRSDVDDLGGAALFRLEHDAVAGVELREAQLPSAVVPSSQ